MPSAAPPTGRLRIGVSACLWGDPVRHDGRSKRVDLLRTAWAPHLDLVTTCPEVEMGLGVPRPPLHLEASEDGPPRLLRTATGEDLGGRAELMARARLRALREAPVAGFVLKARSPSCGVGDAPVLDGDSREVARSDGAFARALRAAFPDLPVVTEAALERPAGREAFLARVEAYGALEAVRDLGLRPAEFLRRWRLVVESREAGAATGLSGLPHDALRREVLGALARVPGWADHERTLQALLHDASSRVPREEAEEAARAIAAFVAGEAPLLAPVEVLRRAVERHGLERHRGSAYLWPPEPRAREYGEIHAP
jgi:uncharacterized protein YbbK (DUF523 family)